MTTDLTLRRVALQCLHESPFNPRRIFGEPELASLAADIAANGLQQPLKVRPHPAIDGDYEIIFGHRRYRAAVLAGLPDVPVLVCWMSEAEVRRAQISENLGRQDVHAIEEAEAFAALIASGDETADTLATKFGKSRSYVYGRLALLKAAPEVRQACLAGEFGAESMLLVARLRTPNLQKAALAAIAQANLELSDGGKTSHRRIQELLAARFTLPLNPGRCLFDPADAFLTDAGACTVCPKLTGSAPEFEDLTHDNNLGAHGAVTRRGRTDMCTDPDCYQAKRQQHLDNQAAELARSGHEVIAGKQALKLLNKQGEPTGGFVPADAVKDELARANREAKRFLVAPPQVVMIQNPDTGATVEAVRMADLNGLGVSVSEPEPPKRLHQAKKEENEAKAALLAHQYRALLHSVRATVTATPERLKHDLVCIVAFLLSRAIDDERTLLSELWPALLPQNLWDETEPEALDPWILLLMPEAPDDLARLALDCALVSNITPHYWSVGSAIPPHALQATARAYGIDAEVQLPPPPPPLPPLAQAQTSGPAKARNDKPKLLTPVRYRCPMTLQTWSGRGMKPAWLAAALANGRTLADFEQKDEAGCAGVEAST